MSTPVGGLARCLLALVALMPASLAASASAQSRPKLAVMPLVALRIEESVVTILSEILATEVAGRGTYEVISASDINAMLGMEKMKSALGCDNETCLAEIGGALGADLMLSGSVGRLGNKLNISLVLFDQTTLKVKQRVRESVPNDENQFEEGVMVCLDKLLGPRAAAAVGPVVEHPPRPAPPSVPAGTGSSPLVPARAPSDDWASGAATTGYVTAAGALLLALGAYLTYEDIGTSTALGSVATLAHGIVAPIVYAGGASARDGNSSLGNAGLRSTGWVAYATTWVVAGMLLYQGFTDSDIFPGELVILTGLTGAGALLCFALDADASHDDRRRYGMSDRSPPGLVVAPFVTPIVHELGGQGALTGLRLWW